MAKEKKTKVFALRNKIDADHIITALLKLRPTPDKQYFVKVSLKGEGRRDKQNRLSFMWYSERGEQSGHGKEFERNYCKYTYGTAILLADDSGDNDHFIELFSHLINTLTYEQLVDAMEFIEVTSLMSVKQFAEYLTDVERDAAQQGCQLTNPLYEYDISMGLTSNKPDTIKGTG